MQTRPVSSEVDIRPAAVVAGIPLAAKPVALLLDADCSGRRQLARCLEAKGFSVEASDDAAAGQALALRLHPVLVVLELRLRAGTGLEVLARLRPQLVGTKFVVLTSYGSVASAVRAMRLGATNYLCKPADLTEVLRAAEEGAANDIETAESLVPPVTSLTLDEAIWEYIHQTVEAAGSLSEAARRLGLWRQSLKRMINKYRPTGPLALSPRASASPRR